MSESLFLSEDDLFELTGYRQPTKQVAHLRKERIPFHQNRAGRPRVTKAVLEGRKVAPASPNSNKTSWSPSWAASAAKT
jgi:hypothetical protein